MDKKTVIILRGISGSGKSTFADFVGGVNCCADDFFLKEGRYQFDPSKLKDAHEFCFNKFLKALHEGEERIVVSNTNTQAWEFERYKNEAEKFGYTVFFVVVENRHGCKNVHGVPDSVLKKQRDRFEIKL